MIWPSMTESTEKGADPVAPVRCRCDERTAVAGRQWREEDDGRHGTRIEAPAAVTFKEDAGEGVTSRPEAGVHDGRASP